MCPVHVCTFAANFTGDEGWENKKQNSKNNFSPRRVLRVVDTRTTPTISTTTTTDGKAIENSGRRRVPCRLSSRQFRQ